MQHIIPLALAGVLVAMPAVAQSQQTARAAVIDRNGKDIGEANLTQTPHGVLIRIGLTGLPTGPHAVHIHETGTCDPSNGFESAGGHFAPEGHEHGYLVDNGPHAGDLPNQWASAEGLMRADLLADGVTLAEGPTSLLDGDGSAIVVHASADDYRSQPSGAAGDRLACGVINR